MKTLLIAAAGAALIACPASSQTPPSSPAHPQTQAPATGAGEAGKPEASPTPANEAAAAPAKPAATEGEQNQAAPASDKPAASSENPS